MQRHRGLIVDNITVVGVRHKERKLWAVRYVELGLTGYGRTRGEAVRSLEKLASAFAVELDQRGLLEERMKQLGVQWHWEDLPGPDWAPVAERPKMERIAVTV